MAVESFDVTDENGVRVTGTVEAYRDRNGPFYDPNSPYYQNPRYADRDINYLNTRDVCRINPEVLRKAVQEALRNALIKFGIEHPNDGAIADKVNDSIAATRQQCALNPGKYVSNETPTSNAGASSSVSPENAFGGLGSIFASLSNAGPLNQTAVQLSFPGTTGERATGRPGQQHQAPIMAARPSSPAWPSSTAAQSAPGGLASLFGSVQRVGPLDQMQPATLPRLEESVKPMPFIGGSLPDKRPSYSSQPDALFPLEALLTPDRDKALDEWSSVRPRRQVAPTTQGSPDTGGSIADWLMNYIRSRKALDANQSQQPAFSTDAAPIPLVRPYDVSATDEEDDIDDPRQDRSSIRRLSRFPSL